MKKIGLIMTLTLTIMTLTACGSNTCARCGTEFTGTAYKNVIVGDGTGVLCEDCAGYEYGIDMDRYKK